MGDELRGLAAKRRREAEEKRIRADERARVEAEVVAALMATADASKDPFTWRLAALCVSTGEYRKRGE